MKTLTLFLIVIFTMSFIGICTIGIHKLADKLSEENPALGSTVGAILTILLIFGLPILLVISSN